VSCKGQMRPQERTDRVERVADQPREGTRTMETGDWRPPRGPGEL
jgi:hypothetical protein